MPMRIAKISLRKIFRPVVAGLHTLEQVDDIEYVYFFMLILIEWTLWKAIRFVLEELLD